MAVTINASTSAGLVQTADTSGVLALQTAGTTAVTVDASQNVGIGTASPVAKLNVKTLDASNAAMIAGTTIGARFSSDSLGLYIEGTDPTGSASYQPLFTGGSVFGVRISGVEKMRIDSSGQLLLGTTTNYFGERLTVYNSNASTAPVAFFYNPNTSSTGAVLYTQSETAPATTWKLFSGRSSTGIERCIIYGNGNIQNTNNSYGAISDIKLKENIVDATPKLDDLMQVKVRNYNLKTEPEHKQIGVVAQELEEIFPSMIEEAPDRDAENNDLGTTTKSVKYSVFVPMLIKAIQEQQALITQLQADVAALKGATP